MNDTIFFVPACNLFALDYKLTKINKKALKLGLSPITTKVVKVETMEKIIQPGWSTFSRVYHICIMGETVRLPGWTFLGTVEHTPAGNILRSVPGEILPVEYRTAQPKCDHCKTDRARKNTFVVRNTDSGLMYQVGRNCTQDFLGGISPERLGLLAELVKEFEELGDEGGEFKGSRKESIHLEEYLETVAALVLKYGFTSKAASQAYAEKSEGAATIRPTSSRALDYFSRDKEVRAKLEPLAITPEVREHAAKALAWARAIDEFTSNDYLHNLRVISHKEFVGFKDAGLVAALVGTYTREVAKIEIERKRQASFAEKHAGSQYVGELKKRSNYVLTLTKIVPLKNEYGEADRALYCFEDSTGNQFIWFSSKHVESVTRLPIDQMKISQVDFTEWSRKSLREGETYQVRGTVKAHNLYKGVKQTMLTRCELSHTLEVKANENLAG